MVHDAVDDRGGHVAVSEHLAPPSELQVRGEHHAPILVGIRDDLEQEPWIGNGVLDSSLEDESLFGEFLRTPVSEGGVEPLVVGPPHVVVGVADNARILAHFRIPALMYLVKSAFRD